MNGSTSRMFTVLGVVVGVWVITYWLYEPSAGPHVSVDPRPAAPREREPIAPRAPLVSTTLGPSENLGGAPPEPVAQTPARVEPDPRPATIRIEPRALVVAPQFRDAVVQRGDTSWQRVARRELGDEKLWPVVARANPFLTSDRLIPGKTVLKIPLDPENIQGKPTPDDDAPDGAAAEPPVAEPEFRVHAIQSGETLWSIARRYYGRGAQWKAIFDANRESIADPDRPPVGASITIPPPPRG